MILYSVFVGWIIMLTHTRNKDYILNNRINFLGIFTSLYIFISIAIVFNVNKYLYSDALIGDLVIYVRHFHDLSQLNITSALQYIQKEHLFYIFTWIISRFTNSQYVYVLSIWVAISFGIMYGYKKIFNKNDVLIVFFVTISSPFFFSYVLNGVRQGMAMSTLIALVCLIIEGKHSTFRNSMLVIFSSLLHTTSLPFCFIALFIKRISMKTVLHAWFIGIIIFVTSLNSHLLSFLNKYSSYFAGYTSDRALNRVAGNNIKFLIFSVFVGFIGLYLSKIILPSRFDKYKILLKIYFAFNTLFLYSGFVAFSNRIATYSWYFIPMLITYPIIHSSSKYKNVYLVAIVLTSSIIYVFFNSFSEIWNIYNFS